MDENESRTAGYDRPGGYYSRQRLAPAVISAPEVDGVNEENDEDERNWQRQQQQQQQRQQQTTAAGRTRPELRSLEMLQEVD